MSKQIYYVERLASIVAAIILLQTLYFKFSAHPDSVHIFSTLGVEPWGRIGAGVVELIAGALLLYPRTSVFGALIALGVMIGAILSHLLFLGIVVGEDKGVLFILALAVTVCSLVVLFIRRSDLILILQKFIGKKTSF